MGRLITVSLILILGTWGGAMEGAGPDDTAAAPSSATRQPPPAPPIKYLEAGSQLFNSRSTSTEAGSGLQVFASRQYVSRSASARRAGHARRLPERAGQGEGRGAGRGCGSTAACGPGGSAAQPARWRAAAASAGCGATARSCSAGCEIRRGGACDECRRGSRPGSDRPDRRHQADEAGGCLHEAREKQLHLGNYDVAQRKVDEAGGPRRQVGAVRRHARQGRPRKSRKHGPRSLSPVVPESRRISRTIDGPPRPSSSEARTAINDRQFEQAEAIALEVKSWGLTYGLFEDNPDKVAAAARALRRRDKIRNTPAREQSSQGVYDILVQESRQLMTDRQARRGRGQGTQGPADERGPTVDGGSGRVGPA